MFHNPCHLTSVCFFGGIVVNPLCTLSAIHVLWLKLYHLNTLSLELSGHSLRHILPLYELGSLFRRELPPQHNQWSCNVKVSCRCMYHVLLVLHSRLFPLHLACWPIRLSTDMINLKVKICQFLEDFLCLILLCFGAGVFFTLSTRRWMRQSLILKKTIAWFKVA